MLLVHPAIPHQKEIDELLREANRYADEIDDAHAEALALNMSYDIWVQPKTFFPPTSHYTKPQSVAQIGQIYIPGHIYPTDFEIIVPTPRPMGSDPLPNSAQGVAAELRRTVPRPPLPLRHWNSGRLYWPLPGILDAPSDGTALGSNQSACAGGLHPQQFSDARGDHWPSMVNWAGGGSFCAFTHWFDRQSDPQNLVDQIWGPGDTDAE